MKRRCDQRNCDQAGNRGDHCVVVVALVLIGWFATFLVEAIGDYGFFTFGQLDCCGVGFELHFGKFSA